MVIHFDADRPSDSRYIERVWRSHSDRGGPFLAVASSHWELVVTRLQGRTTLTLHGPETRAREVFCPADGEWFAIRFKAGTFMPHLPVTRLVNGHDIHQEVSHRGRFQLGGHAWHLPDYDNAETFVAHLVRRGILVRDAAVAAALEGEHSALARRSTQRRFLLATGMSHTRVQMVERARFATRLLREGVKPGVVALEAGYFDQAHLTRSLRELIGVTPAGIARADRQLSFLYKTDHTCVF